MKVWIVLELDSVEPVSGRVIGIHELMETYRMEG